jgi:hypothetical protein
VTQTGFYPENKRSSSGYMKALPAYKPKKICFPKASGCPLSLGDYLGVCTAAFKMRYLHFMVLVNFCVANEN